MGDWPLPSALSAATLFLAIIRHPPHVWLYLPPLIFKWPSGQHISQATHTGFSFPPAGSVEDGVGNARALTASINVPPSRLLRGVTRPPFVPSVLVGVGHILNFAIAPSVGLNAAPSLADLLNRLPTSTAHGVGQNCTHLSSDTDLFVSGFNFPCWSIDVLCGPMPSELAQNDSALSLDRP